MSKSSLIYTIAYNLAFNPMDLSIT